MSRIIVVVVSIRISNRLLMDDWVRYGDILRNGDGVNLCRVAVVRLVARVVVSSVGSWMVVVGRVCVVGIVVVWVWTSGGVGD